MHDSTVYPVKAPNGSTVILYGTETGVGVLWRGGRPLKQSAPSAKALTKPAPKVNGTKEAIVIIDSDDDEPARTVPTSPPQAEFEEEDEELDPSSPYPSIVQKLRLPLNTEVLHIAVPRVPKSSELLPGEAVPSIFSQKIVFAVACSDYTVRIISLPLSPPPNIAKERPLNSKSLYGEEVIRIPTYVGHQTIPNGVSMTWTSGAEPREAAVPDDRMEVDVDEDGTTALGRRSPRKKRVPSQVGATKDSNGFDLLVASSSTELGGLLKIWRFNLTEESVKATSPMAAYQTITLPKPASKIAFNTAQYPKRRHSQLLITDSAGIARIYDPFTPRKRGFSGGSTGAFVALFRTRFENFKSNTSSNPLVAARKPILDAAWVSDGQSILALLADGEWGIWDVKHTTTRSSVDPSTFALRNFVGTSESDKSSSGSSSPKSRSNRASLVPMTPNTRRRKEETLFQSSPSHTIPTRGGVTVASLAPSIGATAEESVIIWYGKDVYRVTDLAKYRARAAMSKTGNSLPGPGLAQIHDVPLLGESIVSVSQFDTTTKEARMAVPRDVLFSAEYRLIISTMTNAPNTRDVPTAFSKAQVEEETTKRVDQTLLSRGELGIDGMQRLLDDMGGSGSRGTITFGNPRKVLFAPS